MTRDKSILIIGCFDTKGEDFSFLYRCIRDLGGEKIITVNTGVMETVVDFPIDVEASQVAAAGGQSIESLRIQRDRGHAVSVMGIGAAAIVAKWCDENKVGAAISMGGGGGTSIALSAFREIPFGIPKICLSTLAGKDVSRQTGGKDIILMPSIVDVAGLNSISRILIRQAAAAICGMGKVKDTNETSFKARIAITMFGNTSACVRRCSELLTADGYEVFAFHANGVGGKTMETLIREHYFDAVLDITTTELADDLCGGVCSAGPGRLDAASETGIPQVVVPGCLDMVNFAQPDTVPAEFKNRELYSWSPDVTLMRTNEKENIVLGERVVNKVQASKGPVTILLPARGISQIDAEGEIFYRPEIDRILFDTIKKQAPEKVKVIEADAHINDERFSILLVDELLKLIKKPRNN